MFGKKRSVGKVTASEKVDTIIGKDTQFQGNITTTGILQIQGQVEGNIKSSSDIIVAETSVVKGDISGVNVVITGTHIGNSDLQGRLEISSTGKVSGDIRVGSIVIEEGGVLDGKCEMHTTQDKNHQKPTKQKESKAISNPT